MSQLVSVAFVILSFIAVLVHSEAPLSSNGYHINRPSLAFTLPIKSSFRVNSKLRNSLPQRNYGAPSNQPLPTYATPGFVPSSDTADLGIQIPTSQSEYSQENPTSVESFEDNRNGGNGQPAPELGRLTNSNRLTSAKQQVESQQPNLTFQIQIPQTQNGFAHALAVFNPEVQSQQQQLITQYQTNPTIIASPEQAIIPQQTLVAPATLSVPTSPVLTQYQVFTPVQQQTFGNLQTEAILNPQYYQVQPAAAIQLAPQPLLATQTVQVAAPTQSVVEPAQAIAGRLSTGEPFARATTGKIHKQAPIVAQQIRLVPATLGKLQTFPTEQVSQSQIAGTQQVDQRNVQPFAYAAIGF